MTGTENNPDSDSIRAAHDPSRDIVTFDRPPVSEVVAGVGFNSVSGLNTAELGRFWGTIAERFPNSEVSPALPAPGMPFPMDVPPRLIFRNSDRTKLLQVQDNWFLFNWVRGASSVYPRYHSVFGQFNAELENYFSYLKERQIALPAITQFRLNYVNHIPKTDGWDTPDQIRVFLPDFLSAWPAHKYLTLPRAIAFQMVFELPLGRLDITIRNGQTRDETGEVLVLDLGISSPLGPKAQEDMKEWFDQAREVIVRSFQDLTSEKAHNKWGLHARI